MEKFIIISNHTEEDCRMAINHFMEHHASYLTHFEWGCKDNDHTAWAIVEAESKDHARQMVPWYLRDKARIVKVVQFSRAREEHTPKK